MNDMSPMRPDQPVSVTLPAAQWNAVIEGLTLMPYRVAAPLIAQIHEQARRAPLDAILAAAGEGASTADPPGDPPLPE